MSNSTVLAMDWRHLSTVPEKRRCYAREPYFREALDDAQRVLGTQIFGMLHAVALAIVRPDALVARRSEALMRFFADHGLAPVEIGRFTFTRHTVRALWRYQWNAATLEKMQLADCINCATETVWLVLRDDAVLREIPTSVRLKTLKGHAVPARRSSRSLRSALGAPNRMLSFVHTADEPADVLREIGILLEREQREVLLARLPDLLDADATDRCRHELYAIEALAPRADLDPKSAWERVLERVGADPGARPVEQQELQRYGLTLDSGLMQRLRGCAGAERWDWIAICAAAVEHDDVGHTPAIAFDDEAVARWHDARETLCRA